MTDRSTRLRTRILGAQPLGGLFALPYFVFVLAIFAYPLIFAVYIAFHDYFFTAPGVEPSGRSWASTTSPR